MRKYILKEWPSPQEPALARMKSSPDSYEKLE